MKGVQVSLIMLSLFVASQLLGLWVNIFYQEAGELPYGMEHSDFEKEQPVLALLIFIGIATTIFLLIIKFQLWKVWKAWFFVAVTATTSIFLYMFLEPVTALLIAGILAFIRLNEKDEYYANLLNLMMFASIGALFSTIFSLQAVIIFLLIISAYDFVSVFMTKHMVKIAKSNKDQGLFAGLIVNWRGSTLVLGGGDVALPLIFQGVVLASYGVAAAFFTIFGAVLGLAVLLFIGEKKKFYPAMPFITTGLLVGLWVSGMLV